MANELEKILLGISKRSVNNTVDKNSTYIEQKKLHRVYITSQEPESPADGELWFDTTGNNMDLYPPYNYDGVYGPIPDKNGLVNLANYASTYIPDYKTTTEIPKENLKYLKSGLKTSNCSSMFYNMDGISEIDFDSFHIDTSQCSTFSRMFSREYTNYENYNALKSIKVSTIDISNATDIGQMFAYRAGLETLDISNWVPRKITNMWEFLNGDKSLKEFKNCDFSTNTKSMKATRAFGHLNSLKRLEFINAKLNEISGLFTYSSGLEYIDIHGCDTSECTNMSDVFGDTTNLKQVIGLDEINTSNSTVFCDTFINCGLPEIVINFDFTNVANTDDYDSTIEAYYQMFNGAKATRICNYNGWNIVPEYNDNTDGKFMVSYMFGGTSSISTPYLEILTSDDLNTPAIFDLCGDRFPLSKFSRMFGKVSDSLRIKIKNPPTGFTASSIGLKDEQVEIVE